ncbi:hypothetical protein G9A89_019214 [Geosiphon pyriformis]|nr:hypothetical protein G9A89_019214 [Geosiphon pyriformis]
MSKKKVLIGVLHGPVGNFFFQKKRVSVGNVKHFEDEKDISLVKPDPNHDVYSDMDSVSGNSEDDDIFLGAGDGSFFDSVMNTPKARKATSNLVCGSPLGLIDYGMDEDDVPLPSFLKISLEKKWVDPKIVKSQIEVSVKKFFALDINFINGFGGATTSSKFKEIIRLTFTSEKSIEMAVLLAREKGINVNNDLKRQGMRSDWAVVIKKIPMNTPKNMIITAIFEFGKIKLIKIQLIRMWQKTVVKFAELSQTDLLASKWSFLIGKDSVHVAKAVEDHETWALRDPFRALLFTLPVGTTAHDFGTLLDRAGGKTCIINRSLETGNRICCAVVDFESDDDLESAFHTEPIFGGLKHFWARMNLVWCEKCGKFGYSAIEYDISVASPPKPLRTFKKIASDECCLQLAKLYEKKSVPISYSAAFDGKSWAQVVTLVGPSGGFHFSFGSSSSLPLSGASDSNSGSLFTSANISSLNAHLATLECFLELLTDQVSGILKKLSGMKLKSTVTSSSVPSLSTLTFLVPHLNVDMVLDDMTLASALPLSAVDDIVHNSSSSFSKVLIFKVSGLESKMVAFEVSIGLVLERLDCLYSGTVFTSGLESGYLGAGVAIIMDASLAKHICKVSEMSGQLISVKLLFKNKLSLIVLGLYTDAILEKRLAHSHVINSIMAEVLNGSIFIVLSDDFNKNDSGCNASFKKCLDLSLFNSLYGFSLHRLSTWSNLRGVQKCIDFILVSNGLCSLFFNQKVYCLAEFFDFDHLVVLADIGLRGFFNFQFNLVHKQAAKEKWKYKVSGVSDKV